MITVGSYYNEMILENIQQLDFNRWAFFIQVYIQFQKIVASVPLFKLFAEYFAFSLYLNIGFISSILKFPQQKSDFLVFCMCLW